MITKSEISSQPAKNVHFLPQCFDKVDVILQSFYIYNLARWSAANNDCLIASILFPFQSYSYTMIILERMVIVVAGLVQHTECIRVDSQAAQSILYPKGCIDINLSCMSLDALCISAQLLQSDDS